MKSLLVSLIALSFAGPALAAGGNAQQNLMSTCNQQAEGKRGEERKAFMSSCLSNGKLRQQEKMKSCNDSAAGKTGAARKTYMSQCLKR